MSIREFIAKIKMFFLFPKSDLLVVFIIILVGFSGFGLGRLSKVDVEKEAIEIVFPREINLKEEIASVGSLSENVVASKNGSKYHFPWCSGAQQIVEKNKISFNSIEEARRAGYTPAANCKGLE